MKVVEASESNVPAIVEMWKEFMDFHEARDAAFVRSEDDHLRTPAGV